MDNKKYIITIFNKFLFYSETHTQVITKLILILLEMSERIYIGNS